MRNIFRLALALFLAIGVSSGPLDAAARAEDSGLRIVRREQLSERMIDLTVDSRALDGTTMVRLLLPQHFADQPARRWPSVYLLHGCCDSYISWTRSTDSEALSAATDVLVVMPEGGNVGFYSDWIDGPAWERFHTRELPALLRRSYRADDRRVIAGNSMGGLGALDYAARHPGMFRAAASFSGITHTRLSPQESQNYLGLIRSQGEDPDMLWGDPVIDARRWAAHNPYDLATKLTDIPLYISVGTGQPGPLDPPGTAVDRLEASLRAENEALRSRLVTLHAPATFHFYAAGTHNWPYWQRELHRAWPMLTSALQSATR